MCTEIFVSGLDPAPQGSKTINRGGYGMRESCSRVKPWRDLVRRAAIQTRPQIIHCACKLSIEFRMERPSSHYTLTGNKSCHFKDYYTVKKNDVDKCIRSTLDSLSGVVYEDDSQVVLLSVYQRYCLPLEEPGAHILVCKMPASPLNNLWRSLKNAFHDWTNQKATQGSWL